MKPARVLIAEDQLLFREGLKALLAPEKGFELVGEAEDGLETVRLAAKLRPDLVLMDLSMPKMSGAEAIQQIKKRFPEVRILVLTADESDQAVADSLRAGAEGYSLKKVNREQLVRAMRTVLAGRSYYCETLPLDFVRRILEEESSDKPATSLDLLTRREKQVLRLIAEGMRNRDIAEELFISAKTVENHRANLMRKLNLHGTAELAVYAVKQGLTQGAG